MSQDRFLSADELRAQQNVLEHLARDLVQEHDALDAVQDVWVKALTQRSYRIKSLSAWLHRVTRRDALLQARRNRQRKERERIVARPDAQPSFLDTLERQSVHRFLSKQIDRLGDPCREVIRLRYVEGLEIGEIATRLRRPLPTVRSHLKRGLDRMRVNLNGRLSSEEREKWLSATLLVGRGGGSGAAKRPPVFVQGGVLAAAGIAVVTLVALSTGALRRVAPDHEVATTTRRELDSTPLGKAVVLDEVGARTAPVTPVATLESSEPPSGPPSRLVAGRVVYQDGTPAADAAILAASGNRADEGEIVATSDGAGRFEASLAPDSWLYARTSVMPRAASPLHLVASIASGKEIDLYLGTWAPRFGGSVLGQDGTPVPDAHVQVLGLASGLRTGRAGVQGTLEDLGATNQSRRTDENGRFVFFLPRAARGWILVTAPGHAAWTSRLQAFRKRSGPHAIRLPEPTALAGRVVGDGGCPASGARLTVEFPHPLPSVDTVAGPEGRFELPLLPPGPFTLRVRAPRESPWGSLVLTGELPPGERRELGRLSMGWESAIAGTAEGAEGVLAGWSVVLREGATGRSWQQTTAPDGRFAFHALAKRAHELFLLPPGEPIPHSRRTGVLPGEVFVRLHAVDEAAAARVGGRFQEPPASLELTGEALLSPLVVHVDPQTGRFDPGPLPPGSYALRALLAGLGSWEVREFELRARESLDLGTLAPPLPGTLALRLDIASGVDAAAIGLRLFRRGADLNATPKQPGGAVFHADGTVELQRLLPGRYDLILAGDGIASHFERFDIPDGGLVERTVKVKPGKKVVFVLTSPRPLAPDEKLDLVLHDPRGKRRLVLAHHVYRNAPDQLLTFSLGVHGSDTCRLEALTTNGLVGAVEFDGDHIPHGKRFGIELR